MNKSNIYKKAVSAAAFVFALSFISAKQNAQIDADSHRSFEQRQDTVYSAKGPAKPEETAAQDKQDKTIALTFAADLDKGSAPAEIKFSPLDISFAAGSASGFAASSLESGGETAPKKHYFTALSVMMFDNLVISGWNRFVGNRSWAKVNWEDTRYFYEHEISWDTDWYWTNFVLHPYQGGLYYMASRASNLNQLESFGVTVLGSTIWEWFFERNSPSINDMVYTTVGAFAVGEMLYRLSVEADEISRLLSAALNPNRLLTDIMNGEKQRGSTGNIRELSFKLGAGTARTYTNFSSDFGDDTEIFPAFFSPEIRVVYNDPYDWDSNVPFSQFELDIGGAVGVGSGKGANSVEEKLMYDIHITSSGMMFSRFIDLGENKDTSVGMIFDYDFIWHSFMELSSLALGAAFKQRIRNPGGSKTEWQLHADALILGTTDYYYYRREKVPSPDETFRDYNYTVGNETVLKFKYTSKNGFILDTDFHGYAMYVFNHQLQDNMFTGWEMIGIGTLNYEIPVSPKLNIGIGNQIYAKKTFYKDIPEIFQAVYTGSLFARLKLK
ncbi:DUF3943 domain-containing protein [Treponema parvum]|uniref:DUF3943 domain-containing protein n=1 Tax=Treponema parvum TaxID=138851 RepID=UPI001AEBB9C5|nr:DUF3943 domain-containing protein [Treponema parvum]QTQ15891.1 DUF3943 domain-containing protein [Treponema parvum]